MPKLFVRHGKWSAELYYTNSDTGKRQRVVRATGIRADGSPDSERTAATAARELEAQLNGARGVERARRSRAKGPITIGESFAAAAAKARLAGSSADSIACMWRSAVHPLRFFTPEYDPWLIDDDALERYALHATQKRAPATVLREIAALRQAMRAARVKPMPKSPKIGGVKPRELAFTRDEQARLLEQIPKLRWPSGWPSRREYVVVYLGLGLSYEELYGIAPEGLDCARHTVRVRGTKRETRDRTVPMAPHVERVLCRALELMQARGDGQLFPRWNNVRMNEALSAAAQRAGLVPAHGRVSVNVLRASFCTELVRADVHPRKIAHLMGHRTIATAMRWYTRLRPDADLHDAVAALPAHDVANVADTSETGQTKKTNRTQPQRKKRNEGAQIEP